MLYQFKVTDLFANLRNKADIYIIFGKINSIQTKFVQKPLHNRKKKLFFLKYERLFVSLSPK